jgi:hypothetical protein
MFCATPLITQQYKNGMFKLSGQDILVIPNKYVDELRNMPDHKLSSIQANIDVGSSFSKYVNMIIMITH